MTRAIYVDAIGGAAGDMLLAAVLDAGGPIDAVQAALDAVLPNGFRLTVETVHRAGLRALLLRMAEDHDQPSRSFQELMAIITASSLSPRVSAISQTILTRLGEAEARVHGIPVSDLEMHELGTDDTLLDVVGMAAALDALRIEKMFVSDLPLASGGSVPGPHGQLPLPAPATLELLRGFSIRGAADGELVTPTAAAILAGIGASSPRLPAMTLEEIGYGAGSREVEGRPNIVRVIVGTLAQPAMAAAGRDLVMLEANIDDLSPELLPDASEALRAAGALDVWTTPVQMKKGRSGILLSALCDLDREEALKRIYFESTSTFGVRSYRVQRTELQRESVDVALNGERVRVKLGLLGGRLVSAKPEHDDVADLARKAGRPVRMIYEEAISAARSLHRRD